jgi:hypothetical protein
MKKYLEVYDNQKTYIFPNMTLATPEEVTKNYSVVNIPDMICLFETDESRTMFYTVPEPIVVMRSRYGLNQDISIEETIASIEEILNAPIEEIEPEPTAEERIAAAMEYQNLLSM